MSKDKLSYCPRKTVIVLDHSSRFLSPSKQHIDLESSGKHKDKSKAGITASSVYKTAWTCGVESAVEYCRIVYDIFPNECAVQVVIADETAKSANSWADEQQTIIQLLKSFASLGQPKEGTEEDCSVTHGLTAAIQSLAELTGKKEKLENSENLENNGRIICITTLKSEGHANSLVACVSEAMKQLGTGVSKGGSCLPVHFIDLVMLHVIHGGDSIKLSEKSVKGLPNVSASVQSIKASQLVSKMSHLVQKHYNLKSTTVTGIPMKEEQQSGSSANYDVEILHPAEAHHEISVFGELCGNSAAVAATGGAGKKEGPSSRDTVIMKWCTPKSSSVSELQPCIGAYRVTPVEVNSRPAACLIQFLLQGRQVMLEQPRKSGGRVVSHVLVSHGGDIFIHCITTSRTPMEDPPSISEGCGGRVTDYRINDFGEFMKVNRLAPFSWFKRKGLTPLNRGVAQLERSTRYWPMVISDTVVCNMTQLLEPLPTLIVKETLSENEVLECKRVIYRLQGMESRNDVLPVSLMGVRGKGPRRDEQYRQMWAELETYLEVHSKTSKMHEKVLDCLRVKENTSPSSSATNSPPRITPTDEIEMATNRLSAGDLAWQDYDRYQTLSERERTDFNSGDTNNDHFNKRSRSTPVDSEPFPKRMKTDDYSETNRTKGAVPSLLSLWVSKMNAIAASRHEEFAGRLESIGNKAELYKNVGTEGSGSSGRGTPVKDWKDQPTRCSDVMR